MPSLGENSTTLNMICHLMQSNGHGVYVVWPSSIRKWLPSRQDLVSDICRKQSVHTRRASGSTFYRLKNHFQQQTIGTMSRFSVLALGSQRPWRRDFDSNAII